MDATPKSSVFAVESFSDVGFPQSARKTRNCATCCSTTGRKIGELDELKERLRQDRHAVQQHVARASSRKKIAKEI